MLLVLLFLALGEIALAVFLRVLALLAGREVALLVVLHRSLPSEGDAPSGLPGLWLLPGTVLFRGLLYSSTQSNVRVTAFFHCLYS